MTFVNFNKIRTNSDQHLLLFCFESRDVLVMFDACLNNSLFCSKAPFLYILLEQSPVIHNRCSTGIVSHSVHQSLGFIKPNLGWTPCCVIDRPIAVNLWPLLLSRGTARPFIYAVVSVDDNCSGLGVDVGWVSFELLHEFRFQYQLNSHQRHVSLWLFKTHSLSID